MMFGCGKQDETQMLRYLDGIGGPDALAVENHLMECDVCLKEMIELNRIRADMDKEAPVCLRLPRFITVFSGVKKGIARAVLSAVNAKWVPAAETRSGTDSGGRAVSFGIDGMPVTGKIIPDASGAFWISLEGAGLAGQTVELLRKGETLPVYSRRADADEVLVRGVEFGDYEVRLMNESVWINIKPEDAEVKD